MLSDYLENILMHNKELQQLNAMKQEVIMGI